MGVPKMTTDVADRPSAQSTPAPTGASGAHPIIFLHLLKTGGTAFHHYLQGAYAPGQIISADELGHHEGARQALRRLEEMPAKQRAELKVIFGHQAGLLREAFPQAPYMTIVREPFERAMSQYVYERHSAAALGLREEDRKLPEEVPLKEFLDQFLSWLSKSRAFDLQARGIADFLGLGPADVSLENVEQVLERFSFIGIQSQSALSVFLLNRRFGFPLRPMPVRFSFSGLTKQYFPQSLVREVNAVSALDAKLFEIAKVRFDALASRTLAERSAWDAWNNFRRQMEQEVAQSLVAPSTAPQRKTLLRRLPLRGIAGALRLKAG
jgi:hypothetical protein